MTVQAVPYAIQSGSHSAQLFRQAIATLLDSKGGIVATGGLAATQHGGGNMSVDVAGGVPGGQIWIPGTTSAGVQAMYYAWNDALVNVGLSSSSPSNPRIDTLIAQIEDAAYAGVASLFQLAVVPGTPTAGANITPGSGSYLAGIGALPASSLALAYVLVPQSASSIVTADLLNVVPLVSTALFPTNTAARASYVTGLTPSSGVAAKVPLSLEQFDAGLCFDSVTNHRYICPAARIYHVKGSIQYGVGGAGSAYDCLLYKNGSQYSAGGITTGPAGTSTIAVTVNDLVSCAAGDYLELWAEFFGSPASVLTAGAGATYMSVVRVG